jgi:heavy metal translocating P-type ATPase
VLRTGRGRIALGTLVAIAASLLALVVDAGQGWTLVPLIVATVVGGVPLVRDVTVALWHRQAGADLLAALAIVTAAVLAEWLVAAIIVLMLSGGEALEEAATARASAVLDALARRSPTLAHLRVDGHVHTVPVDQVQVGDRLVVPPHELCPVDGEVVEGTGTMDESYLTGEPYIIEKTPGALVLSGAVNGETALTVRATKVAADSRYAQIAAVLEQAEQDRPPIRRLADRLGGWYTALALLTATAGWAVSGDPDRFLAVLVIATPCPLLIGIPVAIVGGISLAARNGIIVRDPGMLEEVGRVQTILLDKTGTLTYGRPVLTEVVPAPGADAERALALAGVAERYSRHPLAAAIVAGAEERLGPLTAVAEVVSERPGQGLVATVHGHEIAVTSRAWLGAHDPSAPVPPSTAGLECVLVLDGTYAALLRFRDQPRVGARDFLTHLPHRHGVERAMLLSGDRASEVRYLAEQVGITQVHAECSPEEKLALVRDETARARTLFLGDGINDAPAMAAATVGVAFGTGSDITSQAADAVVLDSSLERLDELLHIGERMRRIAVQSAVGGIAASLVGMGLAAVGLLPPLLGAVAQEVIDLAAILNSARVAARRHPMSDYAETGETRHHPAPGASGGVLST